jgi:hypothetical protein
VEIIIVRFNEACRHISTTRAKTFLSILVIYRKLTILNPNICHHIQ